MIGLTLALILSGPLCCLSFKSGLEGLVIFCVKAGCSICFDSCHKAGVKGEIVFTLPYRSAYLQTQSGPGELALVRVLNVSTLASSDDIGTEQRNSLIKALFC
jgi:hypothetical protein